MRVSTLLSYFFHAFSLLINDIDMVTHMAFFFSRGPSTGYLGEGRGDGGGVERQLTVGEALNDAVRA